MITAKNPWHDRNNPYSREFHEYLDERVEAYKDCHICSYYVMCYQQWDVVKNGVILTMMNGPNGAKSFIDGRSKH